MLSVASQAAMQWQIEVVRRPCTNNTLRQRRSADLRVVAKDRARAAEVGRLRDRFHLLTVVTIGAHHFEVQCHARLARRSAALQLRLARPCAAPRPCNDRGACHRGACSEHGSAACGDVPHGEPRPARAHACFRAATCCETAGVTRNAPSESPLPAPVQLPQAARRPVPTAAPTLSSLRRVLAGFLFLQVRRGAPRARAFGLRKDYSTSPRGLVESSRSGEALRCRAKHHYRHPWDSDGLREQGCF